MLASVCHRDATNEVTLSKLCGWHRDASSNAIWRMPPPSQQVLPQVQHLPGHSYMQRVCSRAKLISCSCKSPLKTFTISCRARRSHSGPHLCKCTLDTCKKVQEMFASELHVHNIVCASISATSARIYVHAASVLDNGISRYC